MRHWCIDFYNGRTNVRDEYRSGRLIIGADKLVKKFNTTLTKNCRFTTTELSEHFSQILQSLVHAISVIQLGWQTFCGRCKQQYKSVWLIICSYS